MGRGGDHDIRVTCIHESCDGILDETPIPVERPPWWPFLLGCPVAVVHTQRVPPDVVGPSRLGNPRGKATSGGGPRESVVHPTCHHINAQLKLIAAWLHQQTSQNSTSMACSRFARLQKQPASAPKDSWNSRGRLPINNSSWHTQGFEPMYYGVWACPVILNTKNIR
jgi:hypothetical protein